MLEKFSNELVLVKTNEQKQRRLGRRRVKGYKKSTKASKGAHSRTALPATVIIHQHLLVYRISVCLHQQNFNS